MKCKLIKENGEQCGANAMKNSDYCFTHNPEVEEEKQLARVKGGQNNALVVGEIIEEYPIRTSEDVIKLMEDTINLVKRGTLDIRVANTIGYLAGVSQKSIKDKEVEQRLKTIEESLRY